MKQIIEEPVTINAGELWSVGGKVGIDSQMRRAHVGQIIAMQFTEQKPSKTKGYAPTKVIKVYLGKDDTEFNAVTSGLVEADEIQN